MNRIICHMTSINNLKEIISQGQLLCKNELIKNHVPYEDIANRDVQDKRAKTIVPFPPGGNLHNYVPFYFWGRTPMLLVNKSKQNDIVFLATYTETIAKAQLPFIFTDRHAIVSYVTFHNDLSALSEIDFGATKLRQWANDPADPARKEKKQAEFLIHKSVPWELIYGIAVINEAVRSDVSCLLTNQEHKPIVKVKQEWYYMYDSN